MYALVDDLVKLHLQLFVVVRLEVDELGELVVKLHNLVHALVHSDVLVEIKAFWLIVIFPRFFSMSFVRVNCNVVFQLLIFGFEFLHFPLNHVNLVHKVFDLWVPKVNLLSIYDVKCVV